MVNHCILAHFHKIASRMKDYFKNMVLVKSYMTLLSLYLDLCHLWVDFSGLQFTSIEAPCLGFEGSWFWFGTRCYFQYNVVSFFYLFFFFKGWQGSSFRALCCINVRRPLRTRRNRAFGFRDSHGASQEGSLVLVLSWKFWTLLNQVYVHIKLDGSL